MSQTITHNITDAITFNVTHAKQLAAKVATDLKRIQRFYDSPSDSMIEKYEAEIIPLLNKGYLYAITYGFKRDGNWIEPTVKYTARELAGADANDDDPGRVRPGADISNASFYSYLIRSSAWHNLSTSERTAFEETQPFQRSGANEPGVSGYFSNDRIYSAGGRALDRTSVKNY